MRWEKSSRVAVPWEQCSKNTWVAEVVSSKACFITKLFLNPAGKRQHASGPCCEGASEAPGRWRSSASAEELTGARGAQLLPAAALAGLHPHAKEEGGSLLQRSPRDPTVISAPHLHNSPPHKPHLPLGFQLLTPQLVTPPVSLLRSRPRSPLPHELVVFSQAFRPAGSTRLYL